MKLRLSLSDMRDAINQDQEYHADAILKKAREQINLGVAVEVRDEIAGTTITITKEAELDQLVSQIKKKINSRPLKDSHSLTYMKLSLIGAITALCVGSMLAQINTSKSPQPTASDNKMAEVSQPRESAGMQYAFQHLTTSVKKSPEGKMVQSFRLVGQDSEVVRVDVNDEFAKLPKDRQVKIADTWCDWWSILRQLDAQFDAKFLAVTVRNSRGDELVVCSRRPSDKSITPKDRAAESNTAPQQFVEATAHKSSKAEWGVGSFEFTAGPYKYIIKADGSGQRTGGGRPQRSFKLALDEYYSLLKIRHATYGNDLLLACEDYNGDAGGNFLVRLDGETAAIKWTQRTNSATELIEDNFMYVAGFGGLIAKLNLDTGRFVWKHDKLYQDYHFHDFEPPRIDGDTVLFTERVQTKDQRAKTIKVQKQSGTILSADSMLAQANTNDASAHAPNSITPTAAADETNAQAEQDTKLISPSAQADEAAIKKQLVGSWQMPGTPASRMGAIKIPAVGPTTMVLKEKGIMTNSAMPSPGPGAPPIAYWTHKWDVRDGVFHDFFVDENGETQKANQFKIISLTKTKLVIQDMYHGRHIGTWIRITAKR